MFGRPHPFALTLLAPFTLAELFQMLRCAPNTFDALLTISEFARTNSDFLVYGDPGHPEQVPLVGQSGVPVKSLAAVGNHFLAHLTPYLSGLFSDPSRLQFEFVSQIKNRRPPQ
jgi:hypothetical protein